MTEQPTPLPLTPQIDVLLHTSRTGRYVTDEEHVIQMGRDGLLKDYGPQAIAGGMHYFTMTGKGRETLNAWRASQPKPKPRTRSQIRYQEFLRSDCGFSFGEWLKWQRHRTPV